MDIYADRAGELQARTKISEGENVQRYDEQEARQAIVQTRQDIVMLYSLLVDLNRQIARVRWILIAVLGVLVLLFLRGL